MTVREALHALGVRDTTLTRQEKEQLDRDGFVPLPGVLTLDQVEEIRRRLAELLAEEGDTAGKEVHQERGTDRLSDLINKGSVFSVVLTHPRVLAALAHVLDGDLKLSSLNSRNALPGRGQQALHTDWGPLETPGVYQVCNSFWLLDDFTPENGATRVVPGTHRSPMAPADVLTDLSAPHPDQVVLTGVAGDVIVCNSHVWHGGTTNRTSGPRRVLHGYFTRRYQPPQLDQQKFLRPETWLRLSDPARVILGVTQPAPAAAAGADGTEPSPL